ncbi:MAG: hypothetical protein H6868_02825 [Rhodospirillales bacterium]|nr:hypothetical protein [Rhodospirillales bacterium]
MTTTMYPFADIYCQSLEDVTPVQSGRLIIAWSICNDPGRDLMGPHEKRARDLLENTDGLGLYLEAKNEARLRDVTAEFNNHNDDALLIGFPGSDWRVMVGDLISGTDYLVEQRHISRPFANKMVSHFLKVIAPYKP